MLRSSSRFSNLASIVIGFACCVASWGSSRAYGVDDSPRIVAPVYRQVGWLNLDVPRPQLITRFEAPDYVTDVAARPGGLTAAVAVMRVPAGASTTVGDIVSLDLNSLQLSPLAPARDLNESLSAPQWSPDGSRVFFQREDVSVIGVSYGGGSTVQYSSRIEAAAADGSARAIVATNARQPAPSPDGGYVALVRRLDDGPALIVRSLLDDSERTLVNPGSFTDIASPRFSPQGDRIAFMVPTTVLGSTERPVFAQLRLAAPAAMHGVPWDLWLVAVDGSSPPGRLASLAADDGTVSWSPDGARLFVYGGTGSFIVDSTTGEVTPLGYISGYGTTSWVAN